MGPLFKIIDHGTSVSIILLSHGEEMELKFSDENTAAEEGFNLTSDEIPEDVSREIPICIGKRCRPGCGCGCARDLGYTDKGFLAIRLGESLCTTSHEGLLPPRIEDPKLFTLEPTKKMIATLLTVHMQSVISSVVGR